MGAMKRVFRDRVLPWWYWRAVANRRARAFTPSIAYPSNLARYDLNFVTQQYSGGIQPTTGNSDDGRFFRQQISQNLPMLSENADGSLFSQNYQGLRIGTNGMWVENGSGGLTSPIKWGRDLTNAAWTKSASLTVTKNRTGRDGATIAATRAVSSAANQTFSQALTLAAGSYSIQFDGGALAGSGLLDISLDGGSTFPVQVNLNAPRYNGIGRYVTALIPCLLNPTIVFRLPNSGDDVHFDLCHLTNSTREEGPIVVSGTAIKRERDRPSTEVIGGGTTAEAHGSGFLDYMAANADWGFYAEWTQRTLLDNAVILGTNLQVPSGSTDIIRFAPGTGTLGPSNTIQLYPAVNKCIALTVGGQGLVCLNGGTVATGACAGPYTALTHADVMTNGAGALCPNGTMRRLALLTTNLAAVTPAMAQAFTA